MSTYVHAKFQLAHPKRAAGKSLRLAFAKIATYFFSGAGIALAGAAAGATSWCIVAGADIVVPQPPQFEVVPQHVAGVWQQLAGMLPWQL